MSIIDIVRDVKNSSISSFFKKFVDDQIIDYGKMMSFNIDSKNKNIFIEVLLKGEIENIEVHINDYEFASEGDKKFIKFKNISASREWINVLIQNLVIPEYAPKKMIEIDPPYAKILDLLI